MEKETKVAKGVYEPRGQMQKEREKPGQSSAGKYKGVAEKNFAGPHHTFPINTAARARNALARAHFAKDPESIREKVHQKYPSIGEKNEERKKNDKRYQAYRTKDAY